MQLLEQEVSDAFEERKNLAKKSGEEAGTKMLFPMMMMFGIIIVIIMVPAFLSQNDYQRIVRSVKCRADNER